MFASIKIPKEYLRNHPELGSKLTLLCSKVREEIGACLYTPEPGALMAFLNLLSEHKIGYETVYEDPMNDTRPSSNGKQ